MSLYVARDGESLGPYTELQIREYIKTGIFTPDQLGCLQGKEEWRPLSELFPTQPGRLAASKPAQITKITAPVSKASAAAPQSTKQDQAQTSTLRGSSPFGIFAAAFFGLLLAGSLLMGGWYYFLREGHPTPLVVPSTQSAKNSAGTFFQNNGQLNGSIFIVTKGGQNYKMGAVQVSFYSRDTIDPFLDQKRQTAIEELRRIEPLISAADEKRNAAATAAMAALENFGQTAYNSPAYSQAERAEQQANKTSTAATAAYWDLCAEQERYTSGYFYLSGIPAARTVTQTDADGKFTLEVPTSGEYAIVAQTSRTVGDKTEHYYWVLKVAMDGSTQRTLMLTNNNMSSEHSPDSLLSAL